MWNRAKKVTILVEDETGFQYELRFGEEGRKLDVESAMNQQLSDGYRDTVCGTPMYQHPVSREFSLKIRF